MIVYLDGEGTDFDFSNGLVRRCWWKWVKLSDGKMYCVELSCYNV